MNTFYNGSNGNGATDSKGNPVVFKFNVTGVNDFDKKGMSQMEIDKSTTRWVRMLELMEHLILMALLILFVLKLVFYKREFWFRTG